LLVKLPADLGDDHFLGIFRIVDLDPPFGELRFHLFAGGRPADQLLESVEINRELPEPAIAPGQDFVFDCAPLGELAQIIDDSRRIGAEIMRTIIVQEHARFVVMIVGISADVIAAVDDEAGLIELGGDPLGQNRPGKTRSHD
jgi:hypothetical protein